MKNLFLLPTEKPSKKGDIVVWNGLKIWDGIGKPPHHNQNIYITNDEEPKDGDWVFDIFKNSCPVIRQLKTEEEILNVQKTEFKIILTDNEDLIKDGVQAIDDEFLEWFVKNPSCEEVEVTKTFEDYTIVGGKSDEIYYKIIIPKEEPKQESLVEKMIPLQLKYNLDMMKQETLEQAAERLFPAEWDWKEKESFIEGAQWQQQTMYSEEDMREAFKQSRQAKIFEKDMPPVYESFEEWFNKFKKK